MKILTAVEMGAADRWTVDHAGVSLETLMDRAGGTVAAFCLRQYPSATRITVLCGKGNNGGDGLVAARRLSLAGRDVQVVLLAQMADLKGEAANALKLLQAEALAVSVHTIVDEAALHGVDDVIRRSQLLIDAVVGTGFKPLLRGPAAALREIVEGLDTPVVAVDLPSGWDADSMEQEASGAFRADAVVTF